MVASGYGTTADSAKKAAIRAAVEQVVGSMVDAETLVENDELVRDEILSYSAGLVESAEFVGEPRKTPEGLVEVRIRAKVKKTELEAKLPKPEKVVKAVNGQSLFAKRVSGRQNLEDAEAMMRKVLDPENIRSCIKADIVPAKDGDGLFDLDPATGELGASSLVVPSWGRLLVLPFVCANHSGGSHEADILFREKGTMKVSLGKMSESDLSDIASVSVEVVLVDPPHI